MRQSWEVGGAEEGLDTETGESILSGMTSFTGKSSLIDRSGF